MSGDGDDDWLAKAQARYAEMERIQHTEAHHVSRPKVMRGDESMTVDGWRERVRSSWAEGFAEGMKVSFRDELLNDLKGAGNWPGRDQVAGTMADLVDVMRMACWDEYYDEEFTTTVRDTAIRVQVSKHGQVTINITAPRMKEDDQ